MNSVVVSLLQGPRNYGIAHDETGPKEDNLDRRLDALLGSWTTKVEELRAQRQRLEERQHQKQRQRVEACSQFDVLLRSRIIPALHRIADRLECVCQASVTSTSGHGAAFVVTSPDLGRDMTIHISFDPETIDAAMAIGTCRNCVEHFEVLETRHFALPELTEGLVADEVIRAIETHLIEPTTQRNDS